MTFLFPSIKDLQTCVVYLYITETSLKSASNSKLQSSTHRVQKRKNEIVVHQQVTMYRDKNKLTGNK